MAVRIVMAVIPAVVLTICLSTVASAQKVPYIAVAENLCFNNDTNLYRSTKVENNSACVRLCKIDSQCQALEIWSHKMVCKMYSARPTNQTVIDDAVNPGKTAIIGFKKFR